jgi:hypothetical protein
LARGGALLVRSGLEPNGGRRRRVLLGQARVPGRAVAVVPVVPAAAVAPGERGYPRTESASCEVGHGGSHRPRAAGAARSWSSPA